jgi:hypothetical protein
VGGGGGGLISPTKGRGQNTTPTLSVDFIYFS